MCRAGENELIRNKLGLYRINLLNEVQGLYYCNACDLILILIFIHSSHPRFLHLTWLWLPQVPISRQWPTTNRSGWWWWWRWSTKRWQHHILKLIFVFIGHILVYFHLSITCLSFYPICTEWSFPLFSLTRCPRHWKSLMWRSNHPVFWRRNFPIWLSSTLLSNHFTRNHV